MPRPLTASYGATICNFQGKYGQHRTIVIAMSKKRKLELVREKTGHISSHEFDTYWSHRAGGADVQELLSKGREGVWMRQGMNYRGEYVEIVEPL